MGATFVDEVRAHEDALRAMAFRLCRNSADAADLVQDTLERALNRFHTLAADSNVRNWLFIVLHNRFIDLCRRRSRQREGPLEEHEPFCNEAEEPPAWADITDEDLRAAVLRLPDDLRAAYELRVHEGRSYCEIARALGIATMTVGTRLTRARARLRALLMCATPTSKKQTRDP